MNRIDQKQQHWGRKEGNRFAEIMNENMENRELIMTLSFVSVYR